MSKPAPTLSRLAYVLQMANLASENGISQKILGQVRAWRKAGVETCVFLQSESDALWPAFDGIPVRFFPKGRFPRRAVHSRALCAAVRGWAPDLLYLRYAYHAPGLAALARRIPAVAEINSHDLREYPITLGFLRNAYHRLTRVRLLRAMRGFVSVTHELTEIAAPFHRPVEVIGNAIDLDALAPLPLPPASAPRLLFVGSPQTPWHGLDRIAELARLFPDWSVDVVGDDLVSWGRTVPFAPPPNLTAHGVLSREAYRPLAAAATVALGTFGLYRKGMQEACPLKVREYLALGLPVIGACADTDIPADAPYHLRLPNDSASLAPHRVAIADFVACWQGRRVPRADIAHLDTSAKEARRLAFLARIAHTPRSER